MLDPGWVSVGVVGFVTVGGAVYSRYRDRVFLDNQIGRIDKLEIDAGEHKKDVNPHSSCAVHSSEINGMSRSIEKIERNLSTLDERIYEIVVNKKKPNGHNNGDGK